MKKTIKPKCPDCESSQVLARTDGTSRCRICGWTGSTREAKRKSKRLPIDLNLNKETRLKLEEMAADENKTPEKLAIELLSVYLNKENIVVGKGR